MTLLHFKEKLVGRWNTPGIIANRLNQTTEDWHTLVGAILVIAHWEAANSRANLVFAPT